MSHASLLVAVECGADEIERAIAHEMAPFDENGEWFGDGTRWDWYCIGGRYSGKFLGENVIQRKAVDAEALRAYRESSLRKVHGEAMQRVASGNLPREMLDVVYGIKDGEPADTFVSRCLDKTNGFPTFYAFLHDRQWHESGRLGWFGSQALTECDITSRKQVGEEFSGRCIHDNAEAGARIVSWQERDDDENGGRWDKRFFDRFVRRLNPDTWLVTVDYHV
jgi:hypothetical protein